jgi:two-component system response regulator CpxR
MTVIIIDNALFCQGPRVARTVADRLEKDLVEDGHVFARAAESHNVTAAEFERVVYGSPNKLLDGLKENRAKWAAQLRVAVAELLVRDDLVFCGSLGYFIPESVTHVLKVCLAGTRAYRLDQASKEGFVGKKAEQLIKSNDESRAEWTDLLLGREPWDKDLFDIVFPVHELPIDQIIMQVVQNAGKPAVATTDQSIEALEDFRLAAAVQLSLADKGHDADVEATDGAVEILIKKHTIFLNRLQRQLVEIARTVPGVKNASARPGPRYQEANIYMNFNKLLPAKVLLVDDEKSYVQTLSKRLKTREIESSVAYGGAEALAKIRLQEPDVMVLDLKMPGVDGLEVLRNVKASNPRTEVIILTAHGSDAEEQLVYQMGAFTYLRKPVDIDELMENMRSAYLKAKGTANEDE